MAVIGAAAIIFCVVFNEWTYFGAMLIILVLCMREFVRIANLPRPLIIWSYVSSILIYAVFFLVVSGRLEAKFLFALIPISFTGLTIQLYQRNELPLRSMALHFLGLGYVSLPISLLTYLVFLNPTFSGILVFALFIMIWCLDVGGYFFGITMGRHKLFERISPKKSWEGAIGGLLLAVVGSLVLSEYFSELRTWQWIAGAVVVSVSGLFGDLVESHMKRVAERKDSGTAIPGHGGFLDRFDSLLYAAPFYVALIKILT